MQFDEQKAIEIVDKFGLDEKTLRVWKTRNAIPDKYNDPNFDTSERLKDTDTEYQKFIKILNDERIAKTKFRCMSKKGNDVARQKDRMTERERIAFKTEIVEIRNLLSKCIKVTNIGSLIEMSKDSRLHPTKIITPPLYSRLKNCYTFGTDLTTQEKNDIKYWIMLFYNFLKV